MLDKIKSLCIANNISVTMLENILGFGRGTILNWETSSPSIANLKRVADYFNVPIDFLIGQKMCVSAEAMRIANAYDALDAGRRNLVDQYFAALGQ